MKKKKERKQKTRNPDTTSTLETNTRRKYRECQIQVNNKTTLVMKRLHIQ